MAGGVLLVGLTGGIGSGKSTVAAALAARGAMVIDADDIARRVVEPGTPAIAAIAERFGAEVLRADGSLDRAELAKLAFAQDDGRRDLEAITHPAIGEEILRGIAEAPAGSVVVCDIPLLAESPQAASRGYAAVIVVEAPREVRLERLAARGVDRGDAEARMAAQADDAQRRAIATHVVDNGGSVEDLEQRVDALWRELLELRDRTVAEA